MTTTPADLELRRRQRWEQAAYQSTPHGRRYARPGDLAKALDSKTVSTPALEKIDDALVALMEPDTEHDALAVFMPPQEGKSQRVSRRFAEWLLDHDPSLRIAIVSYEMDTALRWGRDIKQDVALNPCRSLTPTDCHGACGGLHIGIRRDSMAAARWETPSGGGVYCVGVGGPLTGRPVDVLIIDDPVKDRAAAESSTIRGSTWDWWESVALTRLAPGARVVLVQTRWHEDDLAGRLASRPSPLTWKTLRMPAIADSPDDPLGRQIGEELPSARGRAPGHFLNLRANMSPYVFSGVYQQSPSAPEGNFFRRASFRYWRWAPPHPAGPLQIDCEGQIVILQDCWKFATVDVAASTKTGSDYTVCSVWCMSTAGDLILLDRERDRIPDHDHFKMVLRLRQQWGFDTCYIEKNWWSSTLVQDAVDAGVPVAPLTADVDKVTRAVPAAGRVHAGRVWFPAEVEWINVWCDELAIFPQGAHDDQVDTLSYAARIAVHDWTPAKTPERPGISDADRAIAAATQAATGGTGWDSSGSEFNAFDVPY
jgi:predicted phage terminase large subunit-like protein